MKKLTFAIPALVLVATTAHAQQPTDETQGADAHGAAHTEAAPAEPAPATEPVPANPAEPADAADNAAAAADIAAARPEPATPAQPAAPAPAIAAADVTEAEIDSFAQATVKLQAIQSDTAIAPEQKQTAMVAAVTEVGLDAAKYNAISRAASSDATLRAKVQTAMSKYTGPATPQG